MKKEILEILKQKRREIAQREGKELFKIFPNSVLEETARILPQTLGELSKIKGWGNIRIKKYGNEIIMLINLIRNYNGVRKPFQDELFKEISSKMEQQNIISSDINQAPIISTNVLRNQTFKLASKMNVGENKILSVGELISSLNDYFYSLKNFLVKGEITEINIHPNGYCFFTIKDSETEEHSVSCYLNRWKLDSFSHLLEVGMTVVLTVTPSIYKNGRFSLIVEKIEPYGEGSLKKAFEVLKKKLEAKGYFDIERKRLIPEFIKKIGLITSQSGAAIKDFRENLGQYGFEIYLFDVRVEGDYAEESIVRAIKWFNKNLPELDLLVLIRGGGGLEEFKAFNSEGVAEALAISRLPTVTGIGHERDETIADYVADKRFSTPTAVAVFIKNQREQLILQVENYLESLILLINSIFKDKKDFIFNKNQELKMVFSNLFDRYQLSFSKIVEKLDNCFNKIFKEFKELEQKFLSFIHRYQNNTQQQIYSLDIIAQKCFNLIERKFNLIKGELDISQSALISLNPENILKRGYSIVYTSDKNVLKQAGDTKTGEKIFVKLYNGKIVSRVEEVEN